MLNKIRNQAGRSQRSIDKVEVGDCPLECELSVLASSALELKSLFHIITEDPGLSVGLPPFLNLELWGTHRSSMAGNKEELCPIFFSNIFQLKREREAGKCCISKWKEITGKITRQ